MEDFLYFLKEKRPTLLIYGGGMTMLAWFLFMLYFRLFEIRPFGAESHWTMFGTLALFLPLAFVLLRAVYYFGSDSSPLEGTSYSWAYDISRWLYVAFKNCIVILLFVVLVIGGPRLKYYQMRIVERSGFSNLSYYETRSIFNVFRSVSNTNSYDAIPDEHATTNIVPLPVTTSAGSESHTSSSNSSSSKNKGLGELVLMILAVIAIFASLVYYIILIGMSLYYVNFWLVAVPCIAVGMITLGFIDVEDGPEI